MQILGMTNLRQYVQYLDENYQIVDTTQKTAKAARTLLAHYSSVLAQTVKTTSCRFFEKIHAKSQHFYSVFRKYLTLQPPLFSPKLKQILEIEDSRALKQMLANRRCSEQELDQALVYAALLPSSYFNTAILLELLSTTTFSSIILSQAILQATTYNKHEVLHKLLEKAPVDPETFQEACFRAVLKGKQECLRILLQFGDMDANVFSQAYTLADEASQQRFNS